eukprot:4244190-Alexandrium_andersonii.AAC.1
MLDDRKQHVQRVATQAASAFAAHSIRDAMRSLKQLMPYRPRAPPIVRDGQGRVASTSAELAQMWHSHFVA